MIDHLISGAFVFSTVILVCFSLRYFVILVGKNINIVFTQAYCYVPAILFQAWYWTVYLSNLPHLQ